MYIFWLSLSHEYCLYWTIFPSCRSLHSVNIYRLLYIFTYLIITKLSAVYMSFLWSCLSLLLFFKFLTICRCNSWASLDDQQSFQLRHVTKHRWHFAMAKLIYMLWTQTFWFSAVLPSPSAFLSIYDAEDSSSPELSTQSIDGGAGFASASVRRCLAWLGMWSMEYPDMGQAGAAFLAQMFWIHSCGNQLWGWLVHAWVSLQYETRRSSCAKTWEAQQHPWVAAFDTKTTRFLCAVLEGPA